MNEIWRESATAVAGLIQDKKTSAREITAQALQRIDSINVRINAIVAYKAELALEAADAIATHDSPAVTNLRNAGAVLLGRTNTPVFSYRWFTNNGLHGATLNPHNAALTPGSSSGGATAAVASGMGHTALGTDIAGSVRYPAYACGVHGLRPGGLNTAAEIVDELIKSAAMPTDAG